MNFNIQSMKYIKKFNENKNVEEVCNKYGIKNWSIVDGKVNVNGYVNLNNKNLTSLDIFNGIPFGEVTGNFNCSFNELISLQYAPISVGGGFYCSNNQLKSLKYAPNEVSGSFYCRNNELISLEHAPAKVGLHFSCNNNKLRTLEYAPTKVGGNFSCTDNHLISLYGAPSHINGDFLCNKNRLKSLQYAPNVINNDLICSDNNILEFKHFPMVGFCLYLNRELDYLYGSYIKSKDKIELFNMFNIISGNRLNIKRLNKFIRHYSDGVINVDRLKIIGYEIY